MSRARSTGGSRGWLGGLLLIGLAAPLAAQTAAPPHLLSGRVMRGAEPVPGVRVTLHRVTPDSSGAVADRRTDASGRFTFPLAPADSASFTVYFATAEYGSVRYFGLPVHPDDPREGYTIEVFDTTSLLPGAVRISRRDVVLQPHADGGWEVNEVVRLRNAASLTLVSRRGMPTGEIALPSGADAFEAGDGDVPAAQLRRMGDRVLVLAPLAPGEHDLFFRYRIPGGAAGTQLRVEAPTDSVRLYVLQPAPALSVAGLAPGGVVSVEGRDLLRFAGSELAPGTEIRLEWSSGTGPLSPIAAGVGASLLLLGLGAGAAVRNRRARGPAPAGS